MSLSLMDSSYAATLTDLIEEYLKKYNSIPSFIHAVYLKHKGYSMNFAEIKS
jgi:hypothetical protein